MEFVVKKHPKNPTPFEIRNFGKTVLKKMKSGRYGVN